EADWAEDDVGHLRAEARPQADRVLVDAQRAAGPAVYGVHVALRLAQLLLEQPHPALLDGDAPPEREGVADADDAALVGGLVAGPDVVAFAQSVVVDLHVDAATRIEPVALQRVVVRVADREVCAGREAAARPARRRLVRRQPFHETALLRLDQRGDDVAGFADLVAAGV